MIVNVYRDRKLVVEDFVLGDEYTERQIPNELHLEFEDRVVVRHDGPRGYWVRQYTVNAQRTLRFLLESFTENRKET